MTARVYFKRLCGTYENGQLLVDSDTWGGPRAGSELETQAMARLIREHRFQASISYHNYGCEILYFHHGKYLTHVARGSAAHLASWGAPACGTPPGSLRRSRGGPMACVFAATSPRMPADMT